MLILISLLVIGISAEDSEGYSLNIASLQSNQRYHQLDEYRLLTHYYDTIKKKITLDDGRKVTCSIPLGDVDDHPKVEFPEVIGNVTGKDAEAIIMHLQDTCAHHRTKEFLWEFCPGKYLRQYDDDTTLQNAQKKWRELFFMGFAEGVEPTKYTTVITNETTSFTPQKEHAEKKVYTPLKTQRYIQTLGHFVRLSDSTQNFYLHKESIESHEHFYVLTVYVPVSEFKNGSNIVINPAGETWDKYVKAGKKDQVTKTIDGVSYVLLERLIRAVISPELILLEEELPWNIATSQFDIHQYHNAKIEKKKSFDHTQVYREESSKTFLYKNYLYGSPEYLSAANSSRSIIIFLNQTHAEHRLIISVPSEGVLELNKGIEGEESREILDVVIIDGKSHLLNNKNFVFKNRKVWLFGTVIIGEKTRFKEFKPDDIVFLLDTTGGPAIAREVYKVISDTLMIVRAKRTTKPLAAVRSGYFAGTYESHAEIIQKLQKDRTKALNKKVYKDPALSHINTEIQRSMYLWGGDEEGGLVCGAGQKFVNPEAWLLTFNLNLLSWDSSLMFHFGEEECGQEGIEVHFYKMEKLIITNYGDKGNFQTVELSSDHFRAITYHDKIWILFEKGKLRVGMGSELSEANLVTFFESEKYTKLPYFSINKMFSHHVRINNIEVTSPQGDVAETLKRMNELPKLTGAMTYFEHYTRGTSCGDQKDREFVAEYKCSQTGELIAIENVTEPSMCMYHLTVGTHLLCPEEYKISHKYMDISKQINCVV